MKALKEFGIIFSIICFLGYFAINFVGVIGGFNSKISDNNEKFRQYLFKTKVEVIYGCDKQYRYELIFPGTRIGCYLGELTGSQELLDKIKDY